MVGTGLVLILTIGVARPGEVAAPQPEPVGSAEPAQAPTAPLPARRAPEDRPRLSDMAELTAWSNEVGAATNLPARLLMGYGRAEMWMRGERPGCHLSWATLAGIGVAEAVREGPLPVPDDVWQEWSARAATDGGRPDRADVDDAALTVARSLCSTGADLSTARGWWSTIGGAPSLASKAGSIITAANDFAAAAPR